MKVKAILRKSDKELLFVQAEDAFADFILGLLTIPLGGGGCLLNGTTLLKNIDNLYRSIAKSVDEKYRTPGIKTRLVKPNLPPSYLSKNQILPLTENMRPAMYFFETSTVDPNEQTESGSWMRFKDPKGEGSYLKRPEKFLVMNDLTVELMVWVG